MALTGGQVTCDATVGGVAIVAAVNDGLTVNLRNNDATATNTVVLGPSGVTTTTGYTLPGGSSILIALKPGEALFGIRGTANSVVVSYLAG
jgi:hypothetical protein